MYSCCEVVIILVVWINDTEKPKIMNTNIKLFIFIINHHLFKDAIFYFSNANVHTIEILPFLVLMILLYLS